MSDGFASCTFLPWLRQGLAGVIPDRDTPGARLPAHATVPVALQLDGSPGVELPIRLYGPGDVTGIDRRQVVRTDPPHLTTNFEPNFFPAVEFDRPDLPWLFTPASADPGVPGEAGPGTTDRLRPWLCLVVVRDQAGVSLRSDAEGRPPVLVIEPPALPAEELPDLAESWAWAHTQLSGGLGDSPTLEAFLASRPERTVSRLLCPRRLEAFTRYLACVVPAFLAGRQAGLGAPAATPSDPPPALAAAWNLADGPDRIRIELPVYHHWEFATGLAGNFESLCRRLRFRPLPDRVGRRDLQVPSLAPGGATMTVGLEGALRAPGMRPSDWPDPANPGEPERLRALLNQPGDVVAPPIYGRWYAQEPTPASATVTQPAMVPPDGQPPHWLRELNLDVRQRAAAGLGALVVQNAQEQLVGSAWEQVGDVRSVRQLLQQAQLSATAAASIRDKHLQRLDVDALLQVTAPAHTRMAAPTGAGPVALTALRDAAVPATLHAVLSDGAYPDAAVSPEFRRITRPGGPIGRHLPALGEPRAGALVRSLAEISRSGRGARVGLVTMQELSAKPTAGPQTLAEMTAEAAAQVSTRPGWQALAWGGEAPAAWFERSAEPDSQTGSRFRAAAAVHQARFLAAPPSESAEPPVMLLATPPLATLALASPDAVRDDVLGRLDPVVTVAARVGRQVVGPDGRAPGDDPLTPRPVRPRFPQPMYKALRDLSQDLLLPGVEEVPPETVSVLETNPRFVEAYLVGLNHEMNRELLWRGFPTDLRATPFRHFWRAGNGSTLPDGLPAGDGADIPDVDQWPAESHLGQHLAAPSGDDGQLVLVIRGELLRRYPGATIYAVRATWPGSGPRQLGTEERYPLFRGTLEPDLSFVGFALSEEQARGLDPPSRDDAGWFFVLQEQPNDLRFGLDPAGDRLGGTPAAWEELSWGHLVDDQEALDRLVHVPVAGPRPDTVALPPTAGLTWGANAAHMARITLQTPFRVAVHARVLLDGELEA